MHISPILSRYFKPLKYCKVDVALLVLRVLVFALFGGMFVNFVVSRFSEYLLASSLESIEKFIAVMAFVFILYAVFVYCIRRSGAPNIRSKFWLFMNEEYIRKVCLLDNNYAEGLGTSRMFSIIDKGGTAWEKSLTSIFQEVSRICVILVPLVYLLSHQSKWFIVGIIGLFVVGGWIVQHLNKQLRIYKLERVRTITEYDRGFIRSIQSRLELIQNQGYEQAIVSLANYNERFRIASRNQIGIQVLMFQSVRGIIYIALFLVAWFMGKEYLAGRLDISQFIFIVTLIGTLGTLFHDLAEKYMEFTDQIISIEQLWEKIDSAPMKTNAFTGEKFEWKEGKIAFESVSFWYGNAEKPVLQDFSYELIAGKKYALVGPSGGGKTTISKLASGFLVPRKGRVCIDGQDILLTNTTTLYPFIGYLSQDPQIFDGTVRENLLLVSPNASDEAMGAALKYASADFVYELEMGLDTEIGERGVRLSGGQKQRLAIAKIFLKDAKIIFLDEPTSALDSKSEELISKAFHKLFEGRTVVIIAHRLQTVKEADQILYIENGTIVEKGTHAELVAQGGKYFEMLELQGGF